MDEALQSLFHSIDPLHCVESLETGVLHGVRNVGQSIKRQELRCLGQLSSAIVQVRLEIDLLRFELLLCSLAEVLVVVGVEDVNHEVEVQVEL